ncbi:TPA: hypothetical protein ACMU4L_002979 [Clostridioides difficile]|uniref:hypothetical protein n=1 Tax=Clostridioides difficile TaxID=1496 RepID=UPI001CE0B033|nr:hypothetical protein [Clostridioides difficile]MCC8858708.1 hypothetical protein [Clostridioides difficile]MCC8861607.1 hypothetical protein [Clostridioides difficile]MCC8880152.1 hypothetical protein [Clostridioides difficile]MCC8895082.1 hypothetical protein [Clostridioides difficile]MCC8898461.1 hypothetical protein [Clostridioides difficile]
MKVNKSDLHGVEPIYTGNRFMIYICIQSKVSLLGLYFIVSFHLSNDLEWYNEVF